MLTASSNNESSSSNFRHGITERVEPFDYLYFDYRRELAEGKPSFILHGIFVFFFTLTFSTSTNRKDPQPWRVQSVMFVLDQLMTMTGPLGKLMKNLSTKVNHINQ